VPDVHAVEELANRHLRRQSVYLQALLPGNDPYQAIRETRGRILDLAAEAPDDRFADWADGIARQVAAGRRTELSPPPFSDDLFRQLAESAWPVLELSDKRPALLDQILRQLPPPERELLRWRYEVGQAPAVFAASQGRSAAALARDLAALHGSLVTALREALPDAGPEPPGGAADIGRLSDQLIDGSIGEDSRLVLETLLLGDTAAQVHYHRHAALAVDLRWKYRGAVTFPGGMTEIPRPRLSTRERIVTVGFVVAVLVVAAFVVFRLAGYL